MYALAIAVFVALAGLLLPSFTPPPFLTDAIIGLGQFLGYVSWFVPIASILSAISFVVAVYNYRVALVVFWWIVDRLPFFS